LQNHDPDKNPKQINCMKCWLVEIWNHIKIFCW